ncbi:piggyBac transposable element-derived protein 4 [Trichonephila clavipes]|nr:piggyBac transposable element-derived protein 4 [Trichonephila clavipes]
MSILTSLLLNGSGSQEINATDSWSAGHEFDPPTAEDPPCRGSRCKLNISRLRCAPVGGSRSPKQFRMELIEKIISENQLDEFSATSGKPSISPSPLGLTPGHFPDVIPVTEKKIKSNETVSSRKRDPREGRRVWNANECGVGVLGVYNGGVTRSRCMTKFRMLVLSNT